MSKRKTSLLILMYVVIGLSASGALAQGGAWSIKYYEMFIPPDMDGATSTYGTWFGEDAGKFHSMKIMGDGFGSRAAGDFGAPLYAGIQGDGTARFVDTGAHGCNGFICRPVSNDSPFYARLKVNSDTNAGGMTFYANTNSANGMCVALDTNGVRLVTSAGTIASSDPIDMTTWRTYKMAISSGSLSVWIDDTLAVGPQALVSNWTLPSGKPTWTNNTTIFAIHGSDGQTTNSDITIDWIRLPVYGPTAPQNLGGAPVYADSCDMMVYPHYVVGSTMELGETTATPASHDFIVANTSYPNTTINWTVAEVDSGGSPTDYAWLDLSSNGGALAGPQGTSITVTASLNSNVSGLTAGIHTAYLKFSNDCVDTFTRQIRVAVMNPANYAVVEYCGDVHPTSGADTGGPGYSFRLWGKGQTSGEELQNVARGEVVIDTDAVNQKAFKLEITSLSGGSKTIYHAVTNAARGDTYSTGDIGINSLVGATVVTRVKTSKAGGDWMQNNVMLTGADPYGNWNTGDVWAHVNYNSSTGNNTLVDRDRYNGSDGTDDTVAWTLPGNASYHIVRVASVPGVNYTSSSAFPNYKSDFWHSNYWGRRIKMWYDEDPTPVIDMVHTPNTGYRWYNGMEFGHRPDDQTVNYSWDWIAFTNAGAFGPGEEIAVIGKALGSRCYVCGEIRADADSDGDVDQDDFAKFQTCYSGDEGYPAEPENCYCFDFVGNGKIDADDFAAFAACATGPGIPVTLANAPDCPDLLLGSWEAKGSGLGHLCGVALGSDDWRCTTADSPGCYMSYGPYVRTPVGNYVARFHLAIDNITGNDDDICVLDVADADTSVQLAAIVLTRSDFTAANEWQPFDVSFVNSASNHRMEFRIQYSGNAQLDLDKIQLLRQ